MRTPIVDSINRVGNKQKIFRFKNNFGASVVCGPYTYGGAQGLFELAVIKFSSLESDDWEISYDTPLTEDVIGHLTWPAVEELLDQIEALEENK